MKTCIVWHNGKGRNDEAQAEEVFEQRTRTCKAEKGTGGTMELDEFVTAYETALAAQQWAEIEPLINKDACVTFSSGTVHRGKEAVQRAFERNFAAITDERYRISGVHWVRRDCVFAAYLFDFDWTGLVDGKPASGGGRGTCVLVNDGTNWQLLIEHLGPRA